MAASADCFESALVFSLEKLGFAGVSLKPEQKLAVKAVFEGSILSYWIWQEPRLFLL